MRTGHEARFPSQVWRVIERFTKTTWDSDNSFEKNSLLASLSGRPRYDINRGIEHRH